MTYQPGQRGSTVLRSLRSFQRVLIASIVRSHVRERSFILGVGGGFGGFSVKMFVSRMTLPKVSNI